MDKQIIKAQVDKLSKMVEDDNKKNNLDEATFGKCEWTDINGDARCNSPWSEFQCQQVDGTFTPDASCED
jgi:hypothetical protein